MAARRVTFVGEGMVEERVGRDGALVRHYGGDTLNTAIHLVRLGCDVAFATVLGSDEESDALITAWQAEGLDCSLVQRHPTRRAGRYRIVVDERGERSFSYDRSESAARAMFDLDTVDASMAEIEGTQLLAFSLISLAILPPTGRTQLIGLAERVRAHGGQVAYDGNYRVALWKDAGTALHWHQAAIRQASIGLPTLEDEQSLCGLASLDAVVAHWQQLGCGEVVVKAGAAGCRLADGTLVPPPHRLDPVDTSGAGDAFNAGYMAARLDGASPREAAARGNRLAAWTITRPGAIPQRDAEAPYA